MHQVLFPIDTNNIEVAAEKTNAANAIEGVGSKRSNNLYADRIKIVIDEKIVSTGFFINPPKNNKTALTEKTKPMKKCNPLNVRHFNSSKNTI